MKVFDQLQGVKTATGDPLVHFGLFIGILFIPYSQQCNEMEYSTAITVLTVSHFVNAMRFVTQSLTMLLVPQFPQLGFFMYLLEKIFDFSGVVLQLFAIIFAQDAFFFSERAFGSPYCSDAGFGVTRSWLNLEIFVFYATFGASFLFILLSDLFLKKTGLIFLEKQENNQIDFLLKYKTMNGLYQTYYTMLACTLYCIYRLTDTSKAHHKPQADHQASVHSILITIAVVHFFQFIAVNLQFFVSQNYRHRGERELARAQVTFIVVLPMLLAVAQVIWLGVSTQAQSEMLYFKWIIADVFLNCLATTSYLLVLDRVSFEQKESSELSTNLDERDLVQDGNKSQTTALKRLDIGTDYYALAFCSFIKHYRDKHSITPEQKSMFFVNVCFVYGIQIFFLTFAYYFMIEELRGKGYHLIMVHFDLILIRIFLAFLLHMQSEPEIRQALRMWKYALNHKKARGSIIEMYKKTCGKMHPLPDDPSQISREILAEAFEQLKKYQKDNQISCRHAIDPNIAFLLSETDKVYQSTIIGPFGLPQKISLLNKWLYNRQCTELSFSRDEIYEIYVTMGVYFSGKRADDLFFRSNSDGDTTISCEEFIDIYMKEFEEAETKRLKIVENYVRLRGRLSRGLCTFVTRLFNKSGAKKIAATKHLDQYQRDRLNQDVIELQKFANQVKKQQHRNSLMINDANQKLQVDDKGDLDKILHFFENYGKDKEPDDDSDEEIFNVEKSESTINVTNMDMLLKKKKTKNMIVQEDKPAFNKKIDSKKVNALITELEETLAHQDIFEIKKQINILSKSGKLLNQRIQFMEARNKQIQAKQKAKVGSVTQYVLDSTTPAILISLMQLTSAFLTELCNMHMLLGLTGIGESFKYYIAFKVIALVDNIYIGGIQDATIQKMTVGAWQPIIVYKSLKWGARSPDNKIWKVLQVAFQVFYRCFYFYFFPFLAMMISIMSPRCTSIMELNTQASLQNQGNPTFTPVCEHNNKMFLQQIFSEAGMWTRPRT